MLNTSVKKTTAWLLGCLSVTLIIGIVESPAENQDMVSFRIHLTEKGCQMAIWLADGQGKFIDTIYVTRKVALKGLGNRGGGLDDKWGGSRLSVLPVWAHHRGVDYGGGNFYPSKKKPLADAISSATPKAGEFIWNWHSDASLKPGEYVYYIEVNKSFDDNQHHDYSWYRGQPSVVWKGVIPVGEKPSASKAGIIGHGAVDGADGKIAPDVSSLTTALELIESAEVTFTPGKKQ
jgi:hypothetical protein